MARHSTPRGGESMNNETFVEIDVLIDDAAELAAEAVCACGCGMTCNCIIITPPVLNA